MSTWLSANFSREELVRSSVALRLGIDNTPNAEQLANLARLCNLLLEPARQILGRPFHTDSGFRSRALNTYIGGAEDSAHMDGRAGDEIPIGIDLREAFDTLRRNTALPYDQLIIECDTWLHLAVAPAGVAPRRQAMTASGGPGHWTYTLVTS